MGETINWGRRRRSLIQNISWSLIISVWWGLKMRRYQGSSFVSLLMSIFSPCNRLDCPRGGSSVQRLHALAGRQPPLGRSELRQGEGHGGYEHWPFLIGPQDALVASGPFWAQRTLTPHPAGAAALDLPLSGPLLPRPVAPKQPEPGQWLRRGRHSCDVGVTPRRIYAGTKHLMVDTRWEQSELLEAVYEIT